jgi:CubicO group peptidase (beta-lactamase class C family)
MEHTDAYELDRPVPNLAIGYTHIGLQGVPEEGPRRSNIFGLPPKGTPAGGGYSTVEDLLRFGTALRKYALLSPQFTESLLTGKVDMPVKPGSRYGYGCVEDDVGDQRIVWHNGGAPGISARFDLYRDTGVTLVVLANYDLPVADRIADTIRELVASP